MPNKKTEPKKKKISKTAVVEIPIDQIRVPDERITSVTPEEIFTELKDSIAKHGIIQPLQIMEIDGEFILVDGLHRVIAAQQMGKSTVPCIIRKGKEETLLVQNMIVNRQRGVSDPVGEGNILRALVREHGMNVKQACRAVGISPTKGRKLYNIVSLSDPILQLISHKKLAVGSAEHLLALDDPEKALEVANDAVKWRYTVEQTKSRVMELLTPLHDKPIGGYEFTEAGQPAQVLPKCFACGKEIHDRLKMAYFCLEDFEMLNALLAGKFPQEAPKTEPTPQSQPVDIQSTLYVQPPQYIPPPQPTFHEQAQRTVKAIEQNWQTETPQTSPINMKQLSCAHKFQQVSERSIYCSLCDLTVNY